MQPVQDRHSKEPGIHGYSPQFPNTFLFLPGLFVLIFQIGSDSVIQAGILLTAQAGLKLEILLPQTECQITGVLPSASGSHWREITS